MDNLPDNSYNKEDVLRILLKRSIDQERMLLENERQDRIRQQKRKWVDILFAIFIAGCFVTTMTAVFTTHNVSTGGLRPEPQPSESPVYFTP